MQTPTKPLDTYWSGSSCLENVPVGAVHYLIWDSVPSPQELTQPDGSKIIWKIVEYELYITATPPAPDVRRTFTPRTAATELSFTMPVGGLLCFSVMGKGVY